jgi:hypothetical protein
MARERGGYRPTRAAGRETLIARGRRVQTRASWHSRPLRKKGAGTIRTPFHTHSATDCRSSRGGFTRPLERTNALAAARPSPAARSACPPGAARARTDRR